MVYNAYNWSKAPYLFQFAYDNLHLQGDTPANVYNFM